MAKKSRFFIFNDIPIDYSSLKLINLQLIKLAKERKAKAAFVTYLNAYNLNLSLGNKEYLEILKEADLVYADGWGVVLVARIFGQRLPERLTTKDFFDGFCKLVERKKISLFLLGGEEKVISKMVKVLRNKFPQIDIKGWQNGFFKDGEENRILDKINRLKPDFLIIGMGSPEQEKWLYKNLERLNIKVGWCVGGLFDFISGSKPSCPKWLGDLGFEWFFRLLTEPKRLWQRYLIALPNLFFRLIKRKLFFVKDFFNLFGYAFVYGRNYLLESLAVYFPKIVPKPLYVGLSIGTLCNFKCRQCDFWKLKTEPKKYLKIHQIKRILSQLRKWLGPFRLTLTGAEPFLRKDILEIINLAANKSIYTVLTTNAWLVDEKLAKKIINSGLEVINVSLDGAKRLTHDQLRGKSGSFKKALKVLENLKKLRGIKKSPVIYINTVIMQQNLNELVKLLGIVKRKKIDGIRFQALESKNLFGNEDFNSLWFDNNTLWPKNKKKINLVFKRLISLKKEGYPIKNTVQELKDLQDYYRNPIEIAKRYKFCFTGIRNFAIDEYGKVKLCFGMEPVGDVLKEKPREIWYGKKAEELRKKIRACQRSCRILPCNKREEKRQLFKVFLRKILE